MSQWNNNLQKIFLITILFVIITISGLLVTGLLQSTERIGTSGIVVIPAPVPIIPSPGTSPPPPPPEPKIEINVYSDASCTKKISNYNWGEIVAGSGKSVAIYVKNDGSIDVTLSLATENWTPENISGDMTLLWNYSGKPLTPNESVRIVLTLKIDQDCPQVPTFSFDIVLIAS